MVAACSEQEGEGAGGMASGSTRPLRVLANTLQEAQGELSECWGAGVLVLVLVELLVAVCVATVVVIRVVQYGSGLLLLCCCCVAAVRLSLEVVANPYEYATVAPPLDQGELAGQSACSSTEHSGGDQGGVGGVGGRCGSAITLAAAANATLWAQRPTCM